MYNQITTSWTSSACSDLMTAEEALWLAITRCCTSSSTESPSQRFLKKGLKYLICTSTNDLEVNY